MPKIHLPEAEESAATSANWSRFRRWSTVIMLAGYWIGLTVGTHIPRLPRAIEMSDGMDKVYHFAAYAGLALLSCLAISQIRPSLRMATFLIVASCLAGFGICDEVTQQLVGRNCELADWVADVAGIACGIGVFVVAAQVFRVISRSSGQAPRLAAIS